MVIKGRCWVGEGGREGVEGGRVGEIEEEGGKKWGMKALIRRFIRASIPGPPIQLALQYWSFCSQYLCLSQLLPSHYTPLFFFFFWKLTAGVNLSYLTTSAPTRSTPRSFWFQPFWFCLLVSPSCDSSSCRCRGFSVTLIKNGSECGSLLGDLKSPLGWRIFDRLQSVRSPGGAPQWNWTLVDMHFCLWILEGVAIRRIRARRKRSLAGHRGSI